ncbi:hypothetical protein LJR289_004851 [Pseudoduganella sp. LjRoot289]|uniref:hypothetical protein n=1 Tax=Pseudoduganella sp. LjRoot289 TaxID=3342314 RepID=UPI003ECE5330
MYKKVSLLLSLAALNGCAFAYGGGRKPTESAGEHIVCNIAVAKVEGLSIVAKKIPASSLRTRIDNERYAACPYKVELRYKNTSMAIDFGRAFSYSDVKTFDPAFPVNTGYFILDESGWHGESADSGNRADAIFVRDSGESSYVSGLYARQDMNTKKRDYCFAMALIAADGFATSGICSASRAALEPLERLSKNEPILRYVGK